MVDAGTDNWESVLHETNSAYNLTRHETIDELPFRDMLGRFPQDEHDVQSHIEQETDNKDDDDIIVVEPDPDPVPFAITEDDDVLADSEPDFSGGPPSVRDDADDVVDV